jgi:hypothetical protein
MKVKVWLGDRAYLFITDNPQLLNSLVETWEDYEFLGAVTWEQ